MTDNKVISVAAGCWLRWCVITGSRHSMRKKDTITIFTNCEISGKPSACWKPLGELVNSRGLLWKVCLEYLLLGSVWLVWPSRAQSRGFVGIAPSSELSWKSPLSVYPHTLVKVKRERFVHNVTKKCGFLVFFPPTPTPLDSYSDFGVNCARKNILPTFSFISTAILLLPKSKYCVFPAFHISCIYICENPHPPWTETQITPEAKWLHNGVFY